MANDDSFTVSEMLYSLQHLPLAAATEEFPAVPPPPRGIPVAIPPLPRDEQPLINIPCRLCAASNSQDNEDMIYFEPYDDELIKKYLIPKLKGTPNGNFIVDMNVYAKEPWLLDHTEDPFFKKDEWYYFVKRTQVSEKNIGCGKKVKRKIIGDNDYGSWKANAKEDIIEEKTRKIIGVKQTLTFTKSNRNNKNQKRGEGTSCAIFPRSNNSWIMTEYMLPEGDQFQELVLCKIHEINKSKKKDDDHHEASTCPHHRLESFFSEQQPINIKDHETFLAPSLEQQQPLSCGGNGPEIPHVGFLTSLTCSATETKRNMDHSGDGNMVHQIDALSAIETVPGTSSEENAQAEATVLEDWIGELMDKYTTKELEAQEVEEDWIGDLMEKYTTKGLEAVLNDDAQQIPEEDDQQRPPSSTLSQTSAPPARLGDKSLPIELDDEDEELPEGDDKFQELVLCKIHEINKSKKKDVHHEASTCHHHLESFSSEQQPINIDHESFLAPSFEQPPIKIICEIQENKTDDHDAPIPQHHEFVLDSFSEPINEAHRYDPEIPRAGSEKNDQGLKTSRLSNDAVKEINGEGSPLERCENLGSEKDNQLHMNAPLVCLGSEQEAKEEDETDWLQDFVGSLMTVNGSGLPVEEDHDEDLLNYNTSWIDPDLLDQYATLRPQERL